MDSRLERLVAEWCSCTDGERLAVEEFAPGIFELLEQLVADANREAAR